MSANKNSNRTHEIICWRLTFLAHAVIVSCVLGSNLMTDMSWDSLQVCVGITHYYFLLSGCLQRPNPLYHRWDLTCFPLPIWTSAVSHQSSSCHLFRAVHVSAMTCWQFTNGPWKQPWSPSKTKLLLVVLSLFAINVCNKALINSNYREDWFRSKCKENVHRKISPLSEVWHIFPFFIQPTFKH